MRRFHGSMTPRTPSKRIILAILAVVAVTVLTAGCGGSDSSSGSASARTSTTASSSSFTDCLKSNGVDNFDPSQFGAGGALPEGVDPATLQNAMRACQSLAPQGGFPQGGLPQGAPGSGGGNFTAFSRCMKRNGAPLPGAGSAAKVDATSATYLKAQKKCQPLLTDGPSQ